MKRFLSSTLAAAFVAMTGHAADALYENFGNVTTPPVINATSFLNEGTFDFSLSPTISPFETYDTLNYTNRGTMIGDNGWRFELTPSNGSTRRMANSFANENPGVIISLDPFGGPPYLPCVQALYGPSYLFIGATNIVTSSGFPAQGASLTVGNAGWMQIIGQNVDLSDSGLQVLPVWGQLNTSFFIDSSRTNYQSDVAIYDLYAEANVFTRGNPLNSAAVWDGNVAIAQGGLTTPGFFLSSPVVDSYEVPIGLLQITVTNFTGPPTNVTGIVVISNIFISSNIFKHAVFAAATTDFDTQVGFTAGPLEPNNLFRGAAVLFRTTITNVITDLLDGTADEVFVSGFDDLAASSTFRGLSLNIIGCQGATSKPMNFNFDRAGILQGIPNVPANVPPANFFITSGAALNYPTNIYRDTVTNVVVDSGYYANYAPLYDNIMIRPMAVSGGNETNYTGKIRIYADSLNLENTRIRAEGQTYIQTDHLVSSQNAIVDSENISFNLSSTNGPLTIESIVPDEVRRLRGVAQAWSIVWTNTVLVQFTNYTFTNVPIATPPGSTNITGTNVVAIFAPTTNLITIFCAATMVGGDNFTTIQPVNVFEATANARDVVVNDNMSVVRTFKINSRSFTLNGDLTFPGFYPVDPISGDIPPDPVIEDWTASLAPTLLYLTNNGNLNIPNRAIFGNDRVTPYAAFINNNNLVAAGVKVRSDYFENSGSIQSQSTIEMTGGNGKLQGGSSVAAFGTKFDVNNLKFNDYSIDSDGPLVLTVKNELIDAGGSSGNVFNLSDGFQMPVRPASGSLLGTTFQLNASAVALSLTMNNTWAAEDRGASAAGFVDNAAIGRLVLNATNHPLAKFRFTGSGSGQRAIYVDLLDLESLGTNYASQLLIQPNMTIYYAAAQLGFTPPQTNGVPVSPEEFLDGKFNGRLRWVKTFAGPNSSTPVVVNGQTHIVNSALFNSHLIDSDGDGVPNSDDGVSPNGDKFNASVIAVAVNGNGSVIPNHNGESLLVGHTYTMIAQAADGATFTGWTGSIVSASPTLSFVMASNLTLTANFTYAPVAGTYRGLFYEPAGVQFQKSGAFQAKTTTQRGISGALQIGRNKHSFKATLSTAGTATVLIPRNGNPTLTLTLLAGADQITGTVSDGSWTANLVADRAVFSKSNPTALAGRYTLNIPGNGDPDDDTTPHGDGFGAVTLASSGSVSLKGALADGTKISQSSGISETGQWPLYTSLYSGNGQLLGWMTFANTGSADVDGQLSWVKAANPVAKYYPAGFEVEPFGVGSRFDSTIKPATGFTDGFFTFTGGNLADPFMNDVAFTVANKVVNLSANSLKATFKSDGTFSGTVVDPSSGVSRKFSGALLQKQGFGAGYFLGTDESGRVQIAP